MHLLINDFSICFYIAFVVLLSSSFSFFFVVLIRFLFVLLLVFFPLFSSFFFLLLPCFHLCSFFLFPSLILCFSLFFFSFYCTSELQLLLQTSLHQARQPLVAVRLAQPDVDDLELSAEDAVVACQLLAQCAAPGHPPPPAKCNDLRTVMHAMLSRGYRRTYYPLATCITHSILFCPLVDSVLQELWTSTTAAGNVEWVQELLQLGHAAGIEHTDATRQALLRALGAVDHSLHTATTLRAAYWLAFHPWRLSDNELHAAGAARVLPLLLYWTAENAHVAELMHFAALALAIGLKLPTWVLEATTEALVPVHSNVAAQLLRQCDSDVPADLVELCTRAVAQTRGFQAALQSSAPAQNPTPLETTMLAAATTSVGDVQRLVATARHLPPAARFHLAITCLLDGA